MSADLKVPGGREIRRGEWLKPLLTLTLVVSACAAPLSAHVGNRLIPISYLSEEALAVINLDDGVVEDWEDVLGEPTLTTLDFDLDSPAYVDYEAGPSNFDFRIWLGWTEDGKIYCAGQFVDDRYVAITEEEFIIHFRFRGDSLQLKVDGDHTGGQYLPFPEEANQAEADTKAGRPLMANMQAQEYEAVPRVPSGPQVSLPQDNVIGAWWMVLPPFARGGGGVYGENPTIWSVEFVVTCFDRLNHRDPGDSVVSQLSGGKVIGLDVWVSDHDNIGNDTPTSPNGFYFLDRPDSELGFHDASEFFDGLLLDPDGKTSDSAVHSTTWGRIKASLKE